MSKVNGPTIAKEMHQLEFAGRRLEVPVEALRDGAHVILLSEGRYVGTDEYALSIEEFLGALKANGFDSIEL